MRYLVPLCVCLMLALAALGDRRALLTSKKPEAAAGGGAVWYDLWLNMENGADLDQVNRFMVTNMIATGVASALVYSNDISRDSNRLIQVSTTYKGSGTRSVRYNSFQDQGWIELDFAGDYTNVCGGFYFWLGPGHQGLLFNSYDWCDAKADSGEFAALNYDDSVGNITFNMHTGAGIGAEIPISTNTQYWCAWQWDKLNLKATYVFNTVGPLTAFGTSTIALASENFSKFRFGRIDNHGSVNSGAFNYFDDLCIDTNGSSWAFPNGTTPP